MSSRDFLWKIPRFKIYIVMQNVLLVPESFRCRGFMDKGRKRALSRRLVRATNETVGRCRVVHNYTCDRNVLLPFSWCVSWSQYQVAVYWVMFNLSGLNFFRHFPSCLP